MEINEDDLSSGALYDHLLTSFFADFMHSIETSRFIVTRGFGFRRVITCSFFFNSLKKIRSYLESYIRIYGDMLNGTIVDDHRKVMGLVVDGFEAENDSVSSKYHVTANELMKDIAIIGLLVTSIGLMIGWML